MDKKVAIVTPIHNGKDHTLRFLASLKKQTYKNLLSIVIDDGSSDGTYEAIKQGFPHVTVLKGDGSLWWSGATNKGVRYALAQQADYVFTVNNDVELADDTIKNLVKEAPDHHNALIGSMICDLNDPDKVWFYGGYFDTKIGDLTHVTGLRKDLKGLKESDWLTGMGLLIPSSVFKEIGLFDGKKFPQYYGDADFSLRAKKAGYKLLVTSKSLVLVDLSSSWLGHNFFDQPISFIYKSLFSKRSQFNIVIRIRFYRRYWKVRYLIKFYRHFILTYIVPLLRHRLRTRLKGGGA